MIAGTEISVGAVGEEVSTPGPSAAAITNLSLAVELGLLLAAFDVLVGCHGEGRDVPNATNGDPGHRCGSHPPRSEAPGAEPRTVAGRDTPQRASRMMAA